MAALKGSLALAALHCDLAVPRNRNGKVSGVRARFNRLSAVGTLSSRGHALNHALDGLSCKSLRRGRNSVAVAVAVDVAAPQVKNKSEAEKVVHKVVIAGGGIAGLSAAVALHRGGVKVLVLERSPSIRAVGAALTLWGNGWRALENLGVADGLRDVHKQLTGMAMYDRSEHCLTSLNFNDCPGGPHEVREVERKLLVESLAAQLPPGTIQLNARVRAIRKQPGEGLTEVDLENGSVISTKVLVGCDGVNSVVAKWMGFAPTRYVGQIVVRGLAEFPDGHDFGARFTQYVGSGARCGIFPVSESKVYWFYMFNSSSRGPKVTDPNLVKAEVLQAVKDGWPDRVVELVTKTPVESVSRAALGDRWNIPVVTPPLIREGVVLAGDAMHPMIPNLAKEEVLRSRTRWSWLAFWVLLSRKMEMLKVSKRHWKSMQPLDSKELFQLQSGLS